MNVKLRPKTAFARSSNIDHDNSFNHIQLQTRIGQHIASPGLKVYVEKLCHQADNSQDRAKALELLTSMELCEGLLNGTAMSDEITSKSFRPKTSMDCQMEENKSTAPVPMITEVSRNFSYFNPYQTSYQSHYLHRETPLVTGRRPPSTKHSFMPPTNGSLEFKPALATTYSQEFNKKSQIRDQPYQRTGSSSGQRNNNPHPSEEFMKWRFPRRRQDAAASHSQSFTSSAAISDKIGLEDTDTITNDDFDRAIRGKYQSIYQVDFLGLQPRNVLSMQEGQHEINGHQQHSANDNKTLGIVNDSVGQTLSQTTYRNPIANTQFIRKLHQPPNNRFGCNPLKTIHNPGILPLVVNPVQLNIVGRTTYDTDVNDRATELFMNNNNIRTLARSNAINSLQRSIKIVSPQEKQGLETLVKSMELNQNNDVDWTIVMPHYDLENRKRCGLSKAPSLPLTQKRPMWVSSWAGPTTS